MKYGTKENEIVIIPGKPIGCLTIIEEVEPTLYKDRYYRSVTLICKCGNILTKTVKSLQQYQPQSRCRKCLWIDYTDKTFAGVTFLEGRNYARGKEWKFLCKECNKESWVRSNLINKTNFTGLCHNCSAHCFRARIYERNELDIIISVTRAFLGQYKRHCRKKKGLKWEIDRDYLQDLFTKQDGKCVYTGLDLHFGRSPKSRLGDKDDLPTASLDRIDSDLNYIKGNVQWVHKRINIMKHNSTEDEFISLCNLVVNHNK